MKKSSAQSQSTAYVAFLRGINVGGNKLIKMSDVKAAFESAGFGNVKTLLASGNVIFETSENVETTLTQKIEALLKKKFGHDIGVILRSVAAIREIVAANPFGKTQATEDCKLYVTFTDQKPSGKFKTPYESPQKNCRILSVAGREVFSVVMRVPDVNPGDFMRVLEKEFGRKITTRNWNTVMKIVADEK